MTDANPNNSIYGLDQTNTNTYITPRSIGAEKTGSVSTINNSKQDDLLAAYARKDYDTLAKANLKQPVNNDGDTIAHILAKKLDRAGFELIIYKNNNINPFTYDIINKPNKKSQLPIHLALETIQQNQQMGQDFIDYMINILHANPEIPDAKNRIIVGNKNSQQKVFYESGDKIEELNNIVINNIKNLTKLAETGIVGLVPYANTKSTTGLSANTGNSGIIDFINDLTKQYTGSSTMSKQTGGYNGSRKIKNYISDDLSDTGDNNSFVTKNKNTMLNNRTTIWNANDRNTTTNRIIHDNIVVNESILPMVGGEIERKNKLRNTEALLRLEEEKIRNARLIGGNDNNESRQEERRIRNEREALIRNNEELFGRNGEFNRNNAMEKNNKWNSDWTIGGAMDDDFSIDDETDYDDQLGGKRGRKKGSKNAVSKVSKKSKSGNDRGISTKNTKKSKPVRGTKNNRNNKPRRFTENWDTDDFDLTISDDDIGSYNGNSNDNDQTDTKKSGSNKQSKSANDRSKLNNDDDELEIINSRQMFDYPDMFSSQDRPRTEADDMYSSFVQKIMDLLGVDLETAKFYRSAIKINIENSNPELKKRVNDNLKIKEMESIFENKKKLQSTLDKIDIEDIKKYMSQKKEEGESRKKEYEEKRKQTPNKNKKQTARTNRTSFDSAKTSSATSATSDEAPKPKRARKPTTQSRIADNGYLQSDEILFSPNY